MKIGIIGGTGLLGSYIGKNFAQNRHQVVIYSRSESLPQSLHGFPTIQLVSMKQPDHRLEGLDVLINLAGESILGGRWSEKRKAELRNSRVEHSKALVEALSKLEKKPSLLLAGSAIGFYGLFDGILPVLDEASEYGSDYLSTMCVEWEKESVRASSFGVTVRILRTGVVLSSEGGALKQMLTPFRLGFGGPVATGKQYISWIHINDFYRAIEFLLGYEGDLSIFNLTAPEPVSNEVFSKELAKVLHRPCLFRVPGFTLNLFWGDSSMVVTKGQNVIPTNLGKIGFSFLYSNVHSALSNLLQKN
jgi:uncharacterized protein